MANRANSREGTMPRVFQYFVLAAASIASGAVGAQAGRPLSPGSAADVAGPVVLVRGMGGMPMGGMATGGMGGMATGGMGGMATGGMGGMAMGGMATGGMSGMAGSAGTLSDSERHSHARREGGKNDASVSIWQRAARVLGLGHDSSGGSTRTAQYVRQGHAR